MFRCVLGRLILSLHFLWILKFCTFFLYFLFQMNWKEKDVCERSKDGREFDADVKVCVLFYRNQSAPSAPVICSCFYHFPYAPCALLGVVVFCCSIPVPMVCMQSGGHWTRLVGPEKRRSNFAGVQAHSLSLPWCTFFILSIPMHGTSTVRWSSYCTFTVRSRRRYFYSWSHCTKDTVYTADTIAELSADMSQTWSKLHTYVCFEHLCRLSFVWCTKSVTAA